MSDATDQLEARLGHRFRDRALLERAVTHLSYLPEHPETPGSNQRLEFLGDAVLQLLMTEELYHRFPDEREGTLTKRRALLVNGGFLAELARGLGLDLCLRLGQSEESTGGRQRTSSLGDAFEALIGAVYLDGGLPAARQAVLTVYGDLAARLAPLEAGDNPKGRLQELIQPVHGNQALRYEVVRIDGADHARDFEVAVFLHDRRLGSGRGSSKKLAEEAAAREALAALGK